MRYAKLKDEEDLANEFNIKIQYQNCFRFSFITLEFLVLKILKYQESFLSRLQLPNIV